MSQESDAEESDFYHREIDPWAPIEAPMKKTKV